MFQINCPESLRVFIETVIRLTPQYDSCSNVKSETSRNVKISDKKLHEVNKLTPLIAEECKKCRVNCVVDVGAGLVSTQTVNETLY